jgi:glycerol-3-phosphate dehydrogenase
MAYTQTKNAGQITRDHHIQEDKLGSLPVYSLVGGKWTSFRAFSEQVTDRALAFLGQPRKFDTKVLPIGAGKDAFALKTDPIYTRSEIDRLAKREKIVHLDDLVLRRTLLAYLGQLTRPLIVELSLALGDSLGWDAAQKKAEVVRTLEILADRHGVKL